MTTFLRKYPPLISISGCPQFIQNMFQRLLDFHISRLSWKNSQENYSYPLLEKIYLLGIYIVGVLISELNHPNMPFILAFISLKDIN